MLIVAAAALSVTKKIVEIAQKWDWFAERTQRACKTISARWLYHQFNTVLNLLPQFLLLNRWYLNLAALCFIPAEH